MTEQSWLQCIQEPMNAFITVSSAFKNIISCKFNSCLIFSRWLSKPTDHSCVKYFRRQCNLIPKKIKNKYVQLKQSKSKKKGNKLYWITSAEQLGLYNGKDGIKFRSSLIFEWWLLAWRWPQRYKDNIWPLMTGHWLTDTKLALLLYWLIEQLLTDWLTCLLLFCFAHTN